MSNPTHRMECNAEEAQKATGESNSTKLGMRPRALVLSYSSWWWLSCVHFWLLCFIMQHDEVMPARGCKSFLSGHVSQAGVSSVSGLGLAARVLSCRWQDYLCKREPVQGCGV